MYSDLLRVRQILFNLLSNACKFTQAGTVELTVTRECGRAGDFMKFQVRDTGIGMTSEQLGKVFHVFAQADSCTASRFGGTGLGLAITKNFCEMLMGSIDVYSEPGKGTTFTVLIPRTSMPRTVMETECGNVVNLNQPAPNSPAMV